MLGVLYKKKNVYETYFHFAENSREEVCFKNPITHGI